MHLSPSLAHQHIIRLLKPKLAYRGQPFAAWRDQARAKAHELVRMPAVAPHEPQATVQARWDRPEGSIEKVTFSAEPGSDIVAYWCVPHRAMSPQTTCICLQGHSTGMHISVAVEREDESKPIEAGVGAFGIQCMQRGVAALCLEQRAFGLRRELTQEKRSQHTCHDAVSRALMLGRTLTGERVYDVDRAIDWLLTRPGVDRARIGIMGHSGGGTTAIWALATIDRLAFGMVASSFTRFADSIASISHCPCNCIPDVMLWLDMADLLGSAAPRPIAVVTGKTDSIFPFQSASEHFEHLRDIYTAASARDKVRFVAGEGGHTFFPDEAWDTMLNLL